MKPVFSKPVSDTHALFQSRHTVNNPSVNRLDCNSGICFLPSFDVEK